MAGAPPELHPIQPIKTRPLLFSDLFTVCPDPLRPPLSVSSLPGCLPLCVVCQTGGKGTNDSYSWHWFSPA